jgi:hypothetical protein
MVSDENKNQARFWLEYSQQLSGTIRYAEALAAVNQALELEPGYFDAEKRKRRLERL